MFLPVSVSCLQTKHSEPCRSLHHGALNAGYGLLEEEGGKIPDGRSYLESNSEIQVDIVYFPYSIDRFRQMNGCHCLIWSILLVYLLIL